MRILWLSASVVLVGVGVAFGLARLQDADMWGSVIGALAGVLGLGLTGYGLTRARRGPAPQVVGRSVVGGGVAQVRGVRGNVRIGGPTVLAPPDAPGPSRANASPADGQSVHGTWVSGPVRQVDDVGGDADIDT
ncbi:hypothetical protein Aab01nite_80800 [Paractinoplanes abujensis]|uniref:Uncharacterized protein n=1 Tax=Paractinoplanes abujensis TaxID=882441 RepID=A0A7W7CTX2_9ACTN|nr:hypothetical protein [Actinoplanes abujensis]MBB4693290.1 hypothetical protein [Actinoplanes abujensis]GID24490.1 hypothetical protein Aab01nite_80800 [Actinoplanes abujensis]